MRLPVALGASGRLCDRRKRIATLIAASDQWFEDAAILIASVARLCALGIAANHTQVDAGCTRAGVVASSRISHGKTHLPGFLSMVQLCVRPRTSSSELQQAKPKLA